MRDRCGLVFNEKDENITVDNAKNTPEIQHEMNYQECIIGISKRYYRN